MNSGPINFKNFKITIKNKIIRHRNCNILKIFIFRLTNCSGVSICKNVNLGYTCECPAGYVDGNPTQPGRICGALLCDLCNQHGDCVHNAQTNNITCSCTEGYTGAYCEVAPSSAPLILLIFLALLFLLLTLWLVYILNFFK